AGHSAACSPGLRTHRPGRRASLTVHADLVRQLPAQRRETGRITPMSDQTIKLTADVVALAEYDGVTWILLIQRDDEPYTGCWALPGGHVDTGEEADDAARRELAEETDVTVNH